MLIQPLADITEAHLQGLVDPNVAESQTLDLKRDLPAPDSKSRHEFCADVSAFANTSGGDILFGVAENGEGPKPPSGRRAAALFVEAVPPRVLQAQIEIRKARRFGDQIPAVIGDAAPDPLPGPFPIVDPHSNEFPAHQVPRPLPLIRSRRHRERSGVAVPPGVLHAIIEGGKSRAAFEQHLSVGGSPAPAPAIRLRLLKRPHVVIRELLSHPKR